MTFYESWDYLENHPAFREEIVPGMVTPAFQKALDISVVQVNPENDTIDDDDSKNTKTQVWLECGMWESIEEMVLPAGVNCPEGFYGAFCHDVNLDCGGDTFEEAIIKLAKLVKKHYKTLDTPSNSPTA